MTKQRLGEILIQRGVIDDAQLAKALAYQRSWRCKLGAALLDLGFATEEQVLSALACRLGYDRLRLDELQRSLSTTAAALLVPETLARSRGVCPVAADLRTLTVALRDPTDLAVVDDLAFRTGRQIRVVVAAEHEIWRAMTRLYSRGDLDLDLDLDESFDCGFVPIVPLSHDILFPIVAARAA